MSGRASKKIRRLSTDSEGTSEVDWAGVSRSKKEPSRSRRTASDNVSVATVSRGPAPASSRSPQSMRLTVKTSSNKLREATRTTTSGKSTAMAGRFVGGEILEGKRSRVVKKSYVLESDSEDEDDEMEDDDAEEEIAEDDDEDEDAEDDGLDDEDVDGDVDMDIPPPPVIKISKAAGKQIITAKPPTRVDKMTVEQKELQDASDDEELSELDSDLAEEVEEEEGMQTGNEEDVEGEDEEIEAGEDDDEEDDLDSDDETPGGGSRASTPDLNKLTKRQRARLEEGGSGHLLALPDEVQVKKQLTAEEYVMRRAEMARRRKNLSEKRNEEEKMETINKLLKKQAPKTNARRRDLNAVPGEATSEVGGAQKPSPLFVRWVSNKDGNRIGVPEEWLDAPVGELFKNGASASNRMGGKLIQEVS